jgi:hypothetical protein
MEGVPDYIDLLACDRMEWEILQLLLLSNDDKPWWRIEEVMDATADPITVAAMRFHQFITDPPRAEWVRPTA